MHFLLLGASGRTGRLVLDEALTRGHQVTALVRSPTALPLRENLTIVQGTPLSLPDITSAFSPTISAVVVALNARRVSDSPFAAPSPDTPPRMMADAVANAIQAMKQHHVRKIVIMSSVGTGNSFANLNLLMRLVFTKTNMSLGREDHNLVDELTRAAGVDFVLVRPVMLAEGDAAEIKVFPDDGRGAGFMPKITRASVARFMVQALEGDAFVGRSPVITN